MQSCLVIKQKNMNTFVNTLMGDNIFFKVLVCTSTMIGSTKINMEIDMTIKMSSKLCLKQGRNT
jgi:hypothetical protein